MLAVSSFVKSSFRKFYEAFDAIEVWVSSTNFAAFSYSSFDISMDAFSLCWVMLLKGYDVIFFTIKLTAPPHQRMM